MNNLFQVGDQVVLNNVDFAILPISVDAEELL